MLSVDPSSFQRSAGLTGGGTVSWQLAPVAFDGEPVGPAADAALASAAVALAGAQQGPLATPERGRGSAGALMMADGSVTADTTLREPLGRHPVVTAVLGEVRAALAQAGRAAGHGECVELTLVSTRLYDIDQRWTAGGRPGDLRAFAIGAFRGAAIAARQIGAVNGRRHGDLQPPCRTCTPLLAALGIRPVGPPAATPLPEPRPPAVPVPGEMALPSTAHREWLLGAPFTHAGTGVEGLAAVAARLVAAGPGATAVILGTWTTGGHYTWTAAHRDGAVWWLDNPSREASRDGPLYASTVDGVWAVTLDATGRPYPPEGVPLPPVVSGQFDPAAPTVLDVARLAEISSLVDEYAGADADGRVAARVEIATLVDAMGVRPGAAESNARWAALPADIAAHLLALTTPVPAPRTVATVLGADPARLNGPQKAWQADYQRHLADAFTATLTGQNRGAGGAAAVAADLAARMHRLAVAGELGPASVPRIPAYAGQVIGLPPDRLAVLRESDPRLADAAAAVGIYIDLTGRPDLTTYAAAGIGPVALGAVPPGHDLATEDGRAALRDADRARARAEFRAAHAADPRVLTVLSTHDFHYVGGLAMDGEHRKMALVPDLITAAVRAIVPVRPAPEPAGEPDPDPDPPSGPVRASASVPVPADATTTVDVAYYALADSADVPTGLLVVAMLPKGPQTVRWEAPGARSAGSPSPVSRQRAEEISRQALGFELPAEPRLPEVLNG